MNMSYILLIARRCCMDIDSQNLEAKTVQEQVQLTGKRILEIGCGTGRLTRVLKRDDNFVLAIDPDAEKIKKAQTEFSDVEFLVAEISDLNPECLNLFDLIVFSMSLHHIGHSFHNKVQALRKAKTLRNPGGKILVIEPAAISEVTQIISAIFPEESLLIRQAQLALANYFPRRKFTTIRIPWQYRDLQDLGLHFSAITGVNMPNDLLKKIRRKLRLPEHDILIHDVVYFSLME